MPSVATILALSLALAAPSVLAVPVSLASVVHQASCANTDADCWNTNALAFVNQYRASQGKGALISGPGPMLDNAVEHSRAQAARGNIYHQNLSEAGKKVGCGLFVNRENVAAFGGAGKFDGKGASRQFMDQWINSEGHRKNILGAKDGDNVVVGVYVGAGKAGGFGGGRAATYGTQVFATGDSTCGAAKKASAPTAAPMTTADPMMTAGATAPATDALNKMDAPDMTTASKMTDAPTMTTEAAAATDAAGETKTTDSPSGTMSTDSPSEIGVSDTATTPATAMETDEEEAEATGEEAEETGEEVAEASDEEEAGGAKHPQTMTFNSWREFIAWFKKWQATRGGGGYRMARKA